MPFPSAYADTDIPTMELLKRVNRECRDSLRDAADRRCYHSTGCSSVPTTNWYAWHRSADVVEQIIDVALNRLAIYNY